MRLLADILKKLLHDLGFRLVRIPKNQSEISNSLADVVLSQRIMSETAFNAPMYSLTWDNGFSLHPEGWNPYKETAAALLANPELDYEDSVLKKFYDQFQPRNAAEYLCPDLPDTEVLAKFPGAAFIAPWSLISMEEALIKRHVQNRKEEQVWLMCSKSWKAGLWGSTVENDSPLCEQDGVNKMGPVSKRKGKIEFARLATLIRSLSEKGYQRNRVNDIIVVPLKHQGCIRFVVRKGLHRSAVLAALGHQDVPVIFSPCTLVDLELLYSSPAVRHGYWTKKNVKQYLDFLFFETGTIRARKLGLVK